MRDLSVIELKMVSGGADENEAGEGDEEIDFPDVNEDSRDQEMIEDLMEDLLNERNDSEWEVEYDEDNDVFVARSDDGDIIVDDPDFP